MAIRTMIYYFVRASSYIKKQRIKISFMLLCSFCNFALALVIPVLSKIIFDKVIPGKNLNLLVLVSIGTVVLSIVRQAIQTVFVFLDTLSTQYVALQIRSNLYHHIHRIYISYLHKNKIGDLMARLRGDCDSFAKFIKDTYIILTTSIPIILIGIFMVFRTDWQVGMFTVVYLFLYTIGFALFPERHQAIGKLYAEKSGELSSIMQEGLSGIYTIKTLCTEEEELKKLIDKSQEFIKTNVMLMWSLKKNGLAGMAINIFGTAFLNFYCAFQIINDRMTIGDLVAVMAWVGVVSGPIFDICQQYLNAQAVIGSIERVMTILNLPEQTYEGIIPPKIKGELVFDNVSFSYDGQNNKVIRNFSLKVSPGESLALVGESGAGKTTIVNLILRMEECQEGKILLDGYDISKINLQWLRKNISMVSQDTFLFNASIKDNISYGCSNISESRIYEVSKFSGVHDFVNEFPQGYETIIGERGVKLSGGQRQRIAIARALLRDPVILILDEAMSSVDSETEAVIQENLSKLMHGRTSIIISHRLATMKYANRIAVLGEGMILEIGTFPELVRKNGAFRKLFEKQLLMEPEYSEYI